MANRTRSAAWEFFTKTGDSNLAKCHICCSVLSFSGTTNLLKHLRARHFAETADVMQWNTENGEERTETDASVEAIKQGAATENDSDVTGTSPGQRSGRKNRSLAWNCFRKVAGSNYAECLFCGVHISQESGTTTCLMKHFMGKHPDVYKIHAESDTDGSPASAGIGVKYVRKLRMSNDESDPDYSPYGKRSANRRSVLKRIKVEADNDADHSREDTDGTADGSLDNSMVSSFRNRSLVWQVFVKVPDTEYVQCTICGTRLKLLSGSTTTMLNHYMSKHTEEYQEALSNRVQNADNRTSLVKVHFDQLSANDFWCCLCSRILRQPPGSTSNLRKHMHSRHPKEFTNIVQIMTDDSYVKVEDTDGSQQMDKKEVKSVEEIWKRHCRAREQQHTQQMATLRSRLNTMKSQMMKLRKEMAELETEIRCTEKNRSKEMAREKELSAGFQENFTKDELCESQETATDEAAAENGFDQAVDEPITEAIELLSDDAVVEAVGTSVLMDIDSGRWTQA